MSDFPYIQMPPDGTGKKSVQTGIIELKYATGTKLFDVGDEVTTASGLTGTVVKSEVDEVYLRLNHGSVESVPVGTQLRIGGVNVVATSQESEMIYVQNINITGANNPFNRVAVDRRGAMYTRFAGGTNSYDAFGKLQSSHSTTIREYLPIYDTLTEDFQEEIWNAGVKQTTPLNHGNNGDNDIFFDPISHTIVMQTGTQNGDKVRRRSHIYHKYQTGVATTAIFSMFMGDTGKVGVHRSVGLYDDNDGVYFHAMENNPMGLGVAVRHSVTGSVVENHYHQSAWNVDRLDGSGDSFNVSGHQLDLTKIQVMFIDFQWLGGGRIRFGFYIDGVPIVCHEINNANNITRPWARTGSLPFTMEQYNSAGGVVGNSTMYNGSAVVRCEGEYKPRQQLESGSLPPAVDVPVNSDRGYVFIGAVRPVEYIAVNDKVTKTYTDLTFNHSHPGSPPTAATITTVAGDFLVDGFENGDYIEIKNANKNTGLIFIVDTVAAKTITLRTDSPPMFDDGPVTATIISKKLTPNRAIGEIKDITVADVSGNNYPYLIEIVKNADIRGTTTGILGVNLGTIVPGTGYIDNEICYTSGGGGTGAILQIKASGGNITDVHPIVAGHGYTNGSTITLIGAQSGSNNGSVDINNVGAADFVWVDAYPGNMLDAAKPSTGAYFADKVTSTIYTTVATGTRVIDLREHFDRNTELIYRKATLSDRPDDWTVRVKMFDPTHTAKIIVALSWLEVRA